MGNTHISNVGKDIKDGDSPDGNRRRASQRPRRISYLTQHLETRC